MRLITNLYIMRALIISGARPLHTICLYGVNRDYFLCRELIRRRPTHLQTGAQGACKRCQKCSSRHCVADRMSGLTVITDVSCHAPDHHFHLPHDGSSWSAGYQRLSVCGLRLDGRGDLPWEISSGRRKCWQMLCVLFGDRG